MYVFLPMGLINGSTPVAPLLGVPSPPLVMSLSCLGVPSPWSCRYPVWGFLLLPASQHYSPQTVREKLCERESPA